MTGSGGKASVPKAAGLGMHAVDALGSTYPYL